MLLVLKLAWHPLPFQSPGIGLGSTVTTTPASSPTRSRMYRLTHSWSPASMPVQGPTWYSHCAGITSPLIPDTWMPAYRQAL